MSAPRGSLQALVPAYQAESFIQPTLDSLSAQTGRDFRVLVSVDACDDGTYDVCMAHAARDVRFEVVRQPQRLGWVRNSNFLLRNAKADYVLFAFHDDVLKDGYFAKLSDVLDARPEVLLSYSDMLVTHQSGKQELNVYTGLEGITAAADRALRLLGAGGPWWVPNRGIFRRLPVQPVGGLKHHTGGEFSADLPWLFHLALLGQFARVPEVLCLKYYQPGSLSRSWKFGAGPYREAVASCMRELWNSSLPTDEKLKVAGPVLQWLIQAGKNVAAAPDN